MLGVTTCWAFVVERGFSLLWLAVRIMRMAPTRSALTRRDNFTGCESSRNRAGNQSRYFFTSFGVANCEERCQFGYASRKNPRILLANSRASKIAPRIWLRARHMTMEMPVQKGWRGKVEIGSPTVSPRLREHQDTPTRPTRDQALTDLTTASRNQRLRLCRE
jgi:hypothetical protein